MACKKMGCVRMYWVSLFLLAFFRTLTLSHVNCLLFTWIVAERMINISSLCINIAVHTGIYGQIVADWIAHEIVNLYIYSLFEYDDTRHGDRINQHRHYSLNRRSERILHLICSSVWNEEKINMGLFAWIALLFLVPVYFCVRHLTPYWRFSNHS